MVNDDRVEKQKEQINQMEKQVKESLDMREKRILKRRLKQLQMEFLKHTTKLE